MIDNDEYCKLSNRPGLCGEGAHIIGDVRGNNPRHEDPIKRKHSYNLRAKAPQFMVTDDEDAGEFKKPSSFGLDKERVMPQFLPSSAGSKSECFDDYEFTTSTDAKDLANWLVMLSNKSSYDHPLSSSDHHHHHHHKGKEVTEKGGGMFQCKACKKVFNSHQALGGHRASHKKVKGCFASKLDGIQDHEDNIIDEDNNIITEDQESLQPPQSLDSSSSLDDATRLITPTDSTRLRRPKMHECSVCRRVFTSGQALGGHKRCHWLTTSTDNAFIPNFHDFQYDHQHQQFSKKPMFTKPHNNNNNNHNHNHDHQLDLNLNLPPAPQQHENNGDADDDDYNHNDDHDDKTTRHDASTRLSLQQYWANRSKQKIEGNGEEGYGIKLRKLSDLTDVNLDGGWLQVGIASTAEMMR